MRITLTAKDADRRFAEYTWLNYFNRYLFESGVISEKDYKRMTEKISIRQSKKDL